MLIYAVPQACLRCSGGMVMNLTEMGKAAAAAKYEVQKMSASAKNAALLAVADALTVWKSRNAGCRWESLESFMNPVPM